MTSLLTGLRLWFNKALSACWSQQDFHLFLWLSSWKVKQLVDSEPGFLMSLLTTNSSIHLNEPNPQSLFFGRVVRLKNSTENKIGGGGHIKFLWLFFIELKGFPTLLQHSGSQYWQQGQPRSHFLPSMFVMLAETHEMSLWTGKTQIWACLALGRWSQVPSNSNSWFFSYTGSLLWKKAGKLRYEKSTHEPSSPGGVGGSEEMLQVLCSACPV